MFKRLYIYLCALCAPIVLGAQQDADFLVQVQVFYSAQSGLPFEFVRSYYGGFDREPANIVLDGLPLSRAPRQIRLQISFYGKSGLITPDEAIINGKTLPNTADLVYTIANPASWPAEAPLKISLFANWPALDHWIDIPLIWDGQAPPAPPAEYGGGGLTPKGTDAAPANQTTVAPGHAVQVATSNKAPAAGKLAEFKGFGTVYYVSEPPFYKIRVGPFTTKQEALNQLNAIRRYKNGAYADAFYLYEDKPGATTTAAADDLPKGYDAAGSGPGGALTVKSPTTAGPNTYSSRGAAPGRLYYEMPGISIQLSVHTDPPDLTQFRYLEDLGQVYILQAGGVYKLKIGPFFSREAAEAALPQIQAAGFPLAFVKMP